MSIINTVPKKYLKIESGAVVEMTAEEKTAVDTALAEEKPVTRCPYGYTDKCEYTWVS
jgi:hypothetical protein